MAKFIENNAGQLTEVQPVNASAGAGDATKMIQLDAAGKLDSTLMPTGIGAEDYQMTASGSIGAGDLINIFDNAGVANVRLADATDASKPAMGFAPSAIADLGTGTVRIGNGVITGLTALTIGSKYYLDTVTAGGMTLISPATAGNLVQPVGQAKSATEFSYVDAAVTIVVA